MGAETVHEAAAAGALTVARGVAVGTVQEADAAGAARETLATTTTAATAHVASAEGADTLALELPAADRNR